MSCGWSNQKISGFQKVIFHTSECQGSCPIYHLEIDKDKNVNLHAAEVYEFSTERGYELDSSKIAVFLIINIINFSQQRLEARWAINAATAANPFR